MSIVDELNALDAPNSVLEAGAVIQKHIAAKISPPKDLVWTVQKWFGKQQEQNRYGK